MFNFIHSMRFRVWLIFLGFTTIILGFLYVNQIIFLEGYYKFAKTQESTSTANALRRLWDDESLLDEAYRYAKQYDMRIDLDIYEAGELLSFQQDPSGFFYQIEYNNPQNRELLTEAMNSKSSSVMETITFNDRQTLCYATLVGTAGNVRGFITIYNYMQPIGNTQAVLESQFFLVSCVVYLLAFILSAFVVIGISNPIIKISRGTRKLATGEFDVKVRKTDYAEIKTLTDNLMDASKEIAKTENLRKDLLANVSHDLKTPLTMIKAYAEMIRDLSGNHPEKRGKHIQVIIDEADRLNGLVVDMLDLSKLQSGVATKELKLFNFSQDLAHILERFADLPQEFNVEIVQEIEDNIFIKADISKIEQVVYNLVNNAVNHIGDDGKVTAALIRKKENIGRFEVRDNGSGIAKEDLPYIWERYYKAQKSELYKRAAVGTGLGLSIVKGIMEIHGYNYGVDSAVGKGSTFWFEFPIYSGFY